jgi:NAD(P)-dependent dehydrogenase (short-subunit alcohol dehydrogenase family)
MRFQNKVCLVTGGGSGIGQATCERFAREGGKVAVVDLNPEHGKKTVDAISKPVARRSSLQPTFLTPSRCVPRLTPRWRNGSASTCW